MTQTWSAGQYLRFEDERTRPVRDLLAAIPTRDPERAIDLGCGPGNSTEVLRTWFPKASIRGLDSSTAMIEAARGRLPDVPFEVGDIRSWQAGDRYDLILANAVLQWLPDHETLLPRLVSALREGGSLAIQMPDNLDQPSHLLMRDVARDPRWLDREQSALADRTTLREPAWYFRLLRADARQVDVWRTVYHHPLAGVDAVVEWFKGSALRPYLAPLSGAEGADFLDRYRALLSEAYETQPDGTVLLPFPRLFVVATR
ncbi:MAG: trans-aconitate 2-methyltransferase [Chloroflexi bacterium]|nr:trans-aconitate 2-methyltransferase [Chloroflexota bacterium]